jgi:hypothetical protein
MYVGRSRRHYYNDDGSSDISELPNNRLTLTVLWIFLLSEQSQSGMLTQHISITLLGRPRYLLRPKVL